MRKNVILGLGLGLTFAAIGFSCSKSSNDTVTTSRKLYIATGLCYSGTGFNPPTVGDVGQILSRMDLDTHQYEVIHDYANLSEEDADTYPNGIVDGGDGYVYVAVENATSTGNRRVDKIAKAAFGSKTVWQVNTPDISGSVVRGIARTSDLGVLVGTTTGVERYDATPTHKEVSFGVGWGDGNAGACANNNTRITDLISLPKAVSTDEIGKFIYAHANAGQMDIGVISKNGSNLAASCLANAAGAAALSNAATADPSLNATLSANATPTSMVYIPTGSGTGKLLVAYASSTVNGAGAGTLNNALVMYDFTENTVAPESATINNGQVLYNNVSYFFGVTAMAYDSSTGYLYVATSNSLNPSPVGYNIERFSIDLTTPGATRIPGGLSNPNASYEESNTFNNCVTGMFVSE